MESIVNQNKAKACLTSVLRGDLDIDYVKWLLEIDSDVKNVFLEFCIEKYEEHFNVNFNAKDTEYINHLQQILSIANDDLF